MNFTKLYRDDCLEVMKRMIEMGITIQITVDGPIILHKQLIVEKNQQTRVIILV